MNDLDGNFKTRDFKGHNFKKGEEKGILVLIECLLT